MESNTSIVVVLATYNGGEVLRRTLQAYAEQDAPACSWRIIVCDNNSTDITPQVLEEFESIIPLTSIHVKKPGKNAALNAALDILRRGEEFVIFTDDDAIPQPGFLKAWESACKTEVDVELFGGKVVPYFLEKEPAWLREFENNFDVIYALNDRANGLIEARHIFGPNMAVRRSIFHKGLRFNESIGPNSQDALYPMGSETEFCVRAEAQLGSAAYFASGPVVAHQIRAKQMDLEFITGRAYRHGRGFAFQEMEKNPEIFRKRLTIISKLKAFIKINWYHSLALMKAKNALWEYNWWRGYYSVA